MARNAAGDTQEDRVTRLSGDRTDIGPWRSELGNVSGYREQVPWSEDPVDSGWRIALAEFSQASELD